MHFRDIFKKSFIEGYATQTLTFQTIMTCMIVTALISLFIYWVYRIVRKSEFYNRSFALSLMLLSIITAAIILTIQSNIVVSLGMVGALSIVRFRTAVKDPIDLVFLFWAISTGIICGAGFAIIAVIASIIATICLMIFANRKNVGKDVLLVVNLKDYRREDEFWTVLGELCKNYQVRAQNASEDRMNIVVEIQKKDAAGLIGKLMAKEYVSTASIVEHDGEVTV